MSKDYITIDAKPEWQTHYDPVLVGKYLIWHDEQYPLNQRDFLEVIQAGITIFPMQHEPSLDGFLRWCATDKGENK